MPIKSRLPPTSGHNPFHHYQIRFKTITFCRTTLHLPLPTPFPPASRPHHVPITTLSQIPNPNTTPTSPNHTYLQPTQTQPNHAVRSPSPSPSTSPSHLTKPPPSQKQLASLRRTQPIRRQSRAQPGSQVLGAGKLAGNPSRARGVARDGKVGEIGSRTGCGAGDAAKEGGGEGGATEGGGKGRSAGARDAAKEGGGEEVEVGWGRSAGRDGRWWGCGGWVRISMIGTGIDG